MEGASIGSTVGYPVLGGARAPEGTLTCLHAYLPANGDHCVACLHAAVCEGCVVRLQEERSAGEVLCVSQKQGAAGTFSSGVWGKGCMTGGAGGKANIQHHMVDDV